MSDGSYPDSVVETYPCHDLNSDVMQHSAQQHGHRGGVVSDKLPVALGQQSSRHDSKHHQSVSQTNDDHQLEHGEKKKVMCNHLKQI